MKEFKILTNEEEKKLSKEELIEYYKKLKEYLKNTKYKQQHNLTLKIKETLNPLTKKIVNLVMKYKFIIDGQENVPTGPVIYACSHQDFNDITNSIYANPEHCLTLNASNIRAWIKPLLINNGVIFMDRNSKYSRYEATIEMEKALAKGKSINIYPEATWNCTPSKLHLPFYIGMIKMAQRIQVPIIPVVQEYTYDETKLDGKSHVISVHIRFGKPVHVGYDDDILEKLAEFDEIFSTIRWELIEEKAPKENNKDRLTTAIIDGKKEIVYDRDKISNRLYTNYIETRINDWKLPGNDIIEERDAVFGSNDERYLMYPVNDVEYKKNKDYFKDDELLQTEFTRKYLAPNHRLIKK